MFGRFTRAAAAVAMLTIVAGCAVPDFLGRIETGYQTVSDSSVPPKTVASGIAAFDGLKVSATNYLRLRRCNGANAPICRDPALTGQIDAAIQTGTVARNGLKAFLRQHPDSLGPQGLYDSLVSATDTIDKATAAYRAAKATPQ